MNLNELPKGAKIYFLGIGGISMSAIAMILKGKGYDISGYDRTKSDVTDRLEKNGIKVFDNFDESHLEGVTHAVFSAAFLPEHPLMQAIKSKGIKLFSRAEILGSIASMYKNSVAVAGTHGKSTTSGMLAHIFLNAKGCDPTSVVGAVMRDVGSTYRIGTDDNFLFEACEYKDSFLSFYPNIAVILNISLDHTDYFKDIEDIKKSFAKFASNTGKNGCTVFNLDCRNCKDALKNYEGRKITFSENGNENADYYAKNIEMIGGYASFDVYKDKEFFLSVKLSEPGRHNVSNSLAAIAVCDICGISKEDIVKGIVSFSGVGRRFEYKGSFCGADVYDDYAHHPDEIKATLAAAKSVAKGRVICVFQPHNYSRLRDLYADFKTSFSDADLLVLCPLFAAREACGTEVSSKMLSEELDNSVYFDTFDEIKDYLKTVLRDGDLLMIMGAGDISKLANSIG